MAVVIEASARSIGTSFGCESGEDQGRPHRVRRQIMVGSSPRLGRASHHYLSSGGNIKTKAVGRNSESKRLDSIYGFGHILVGFAIRGSLKSGASRLSDRANHTYSPESSFAISNGALPG